MTTATQEPLIRLSGAVKRYGQVTALAGMDVEVFPGETVGILGANGAGKKTLIESIMGARLLDEGDIEVCGFSPARQREECARFEHLSMAESLELQYSVLQGSAVCIAWTVIMLLLAWRGFRWDAQG